MEVLSWFLVERDAPEWLREASQASYVNNFGPAGVFFEQDDAEAWKAITESVQGPFAGEGLLNYEMGMDLTPLNDWPGPGEAPEWVRRAEPATVLGAMAGLHEPTCPVPRRCSMTILPRLLSRCTPVQRSTAGE